MKKFVLLCLSMGQAFAQGNVFDLQYLNQKGQWWAQTSYVHDKERFTVGPTDKNEIRSRALEQSLWYGLSEKTTLTLNLAYTLQEKSHTLDYHNEGLQDFALGFKHRLMIEGDTMLDLVAQLRSGLGDARQGVAGERGNGFSGGRVLAIGLDYGRKKEDFQWNFVVGAEYLGNIKRYRADNHGQLDRHYRHRIDYHATYSALWTLSEVFSFSANFFVDITGRQDEVVEGIETHGYLSYGWGLKGFYNPAKWKNAALFAGVLSRSGAGSHRSQDGFSVGRIRDRYLLSYALGAIYRF